MTVRVLLADDHPIVRQGMRRLLESQPDFHIAGEAGDGLEALDLAEQLKPDILILDLMMPGLTGMEVVRQVHQRLPDTRVIILSMHKDENYVLHALRNGAKGYILKDTGPGQLVQAIRSVMEGFRYLSPEISERLIDKLLEKPGDENEAGNEKLTNREHEVLQLTAEGLTSAEAASRLSISPRTVEMHRANIMQKLGLRNQTDLLRYALKTGILSLED
jgi:DNA-binding NarL/FixJ family response regulator